MALNLSHRAFFPVNPPEDKLVSSVSNSKCFDWEFGNSFDSGKDGADKGGSIESVTNDIIDLLPSDPFGMGISATFTAIAGWVEDFESDRLNSMWNRTLRFQTEPNKMEFYEESIPCGGYDGNMGESKSGSQQDQSSLLYRPEKFLSFNSKDVHVASHKSEESGKGSGVCHGGDERAPHDALLFSLGYLSVQDLLSVEMVCKSLHSAIRSDVLLWKNIYIDHPLSARITNDALLSLTNRAQGLLLCLSLVGCSNITDIGLKRVLECNPRITKLNVTKCTGLSIGGIVENLKAFKSSAISGINHLRIGSRIDAAREHFEELKSLVGTNGGAQPKTNKPQYFCGGHSTFSNDDREIDIEICPRCEKCTLVYDCPAESCQGKQSGTQICRACKICIPRCTGCGCCVGESEYVEDFCLDLICSQCWKNPLSSEERHDQKGAYSKHTIFHHETKFCIQLWG